MRAWLVILVACSSHHEAAPKPTGPETCTPARLDESTLEECEAHCRDGSAIACAVAAHKRCSGISMPHKDVSGCLKLALRGCELGAADGCNWAALVYSGTQDGRDRDADREDVMYRREVELLEKDCTAGNAKACIDLVLWYEPSQATPPWFTADHARAVKYRERGMELAQQACDRGDGYACSLLATEYMQHDAQRVADPQRSFALSKRACELGHGESCTLYASGDEAEVQGLLRHGCDLGNADSCAMLATHVSYENHDAEMLQLLQRACDLRSATWCHDLGRALDKTDHVRAAAAFAKACSYGNADDCTRSAAPSP